MPPPPLNPPPVNAFSLLELSAPRVAVRSPSTTCVPASRPVTWALPPPTVPTVTDFVVTWSEPETTWMVALPVATMVRADAGTVTTLLTLLVVTATCAWESWARAWGGLSTVMVTGYVGVLLVLSAGRMPIWVTDPLTVPPPPAGVTTAAWPTASVGNADRGTSTVTWAAPVPMIVMLDEVDASWPLVNPTLATVPLMGAVSVAEFTASWAWLTSSSAALTVIVPPPPVPPPAAPPLDAPLPDPVPLEPVPLEPVPLEPVLPEELPLAPLLEEDPFEEEPPEALPPEPLVVPPLVPPDPPLVDEEPLEPDFELSWPRRVFNWVRVDDACSKVADADWVADTQAFTTAGSSDADGDAEEELELLLGVPVLVVGSEVDGSEVVGADVLVPVLVGDAVSVDVGVLVAVEVWLGVSVEVEDACEVELLDEVRVPERDVPPVVPVDPPAAITGAQVTC